MGYRILIVDDSAITRQVVRRVVGMTGLATDDIQEAINGVEALQVMSTNEVDLVFADLNMPVMGGVELVQRMSEDEALSRTPVIVITSNRNQDRLDELRRLGVKACLAKPFRPEDLRDEILNATGQGHGGDDE